MSNTKDLRALAEHNAQRLIDDANVAAVIITGSVATGEIDRHSDIDTIVYLHEPVSAERFEQEREHAIASGGGFYGGTPEAGFGFFFVADGTKCDLGFSRVRAVDELIDDVLERLDLDSDKQLIIRGIRRSVVLKGEDVVEGWRQRTDSYPDALARAMVERHLSQPPVRAVRAIAADRDDRLFVLELVIESIRRLSAVLFGLNRVYSPGKLKSLAGACAELAIAPAAVGPRLHALAARPPVEMVDELGALIGETFDLVEARMPDIDVGPARRRLELDPRAWTITRSGD